MASSVMPLARAPNSSHYRTFNNLSAPLKPSCISFPSTHDSKHMNLSLFNPLFIRSRFKPSLALESNVPYSSNQGSEKLESNAKSYEDWDVWSAKFSGASNVPFLILQLPQIVLNVRNLLAGNKSALFAVPWLGMLTGLLGNLSLLSYFAKKREKEVVLVQTLGVVSIYTVLVTLAMAEAMPLQHFVVTSVVIFTGLIVNFMYYFNFLNDAVWRLWEDFITVGGVSVLPQVIWSTFVPVIPDSILPGTIACALAIVTVVMARTGKLPEKGVKFVGSISGWTATLLFMWMPIAQMWTNLLNPDNIKGLSAFSMLLAMIGNGLMLPRALFIRDLMWFTGSSWASVLYGWGNLICLYCFNSISREFFFSATFGLLAWIGITFWGDMKAYKYSSPLRSLKELFVGA